MDYGFTTLVKTMTNYTFSSNKGISYCGSLKILSILEKMKYPTRNYSTIFK